MEKFISIIIPVYNTEKYLSKCLDSIVNQTIYENLEIICINDASTDSSLNILQEYSKKYKNIVVIDSKINLKQGGARNLGLDRAIGEYIGFIDSDDFIDETMYEKLYLEGKKENADIVCCDYYHSYFSEKKYHVSLTKNDLGIIDKEKRKKLIINPESICCKIFKKDLIKKIKFPEKLFYEDNYFSPIVMMYCKKVVKVEEALYYYRQDNISTTRQKDNFNFYDRLITNKMLLDDMRRIDKESYYKEEYEWLYIKLFYINSLHGSINNFTKYPSLKIKEIKDGLKKEIPDYKKNFYLRMEKRNIIKRLKLYLLSNYTKVYWWMKKCIRK